MSTDEYQFWLIAIIGIGLTAMPLLWMLINAAKYDHHRQGMLFNLPPYIYDEWVKSGKIDAKGRLV